VAAVLALSPSLGRLSPAATAEAAPAELVAAIRDSGTVPHTGVVNASGTLAVPDADTFTSLGETFGEANRIRVFWRDEERWRLDRIRATGETDLYRTALGTTRWVYESRRVRVTLNAPVRLPDTSDVLPDTLARRVLQGARPEELAALPTRRIAGVDAAGLRLTPATPQSSIDRVDIWADPGSGLPLRVEVYAGSAQPAVSTAYERVELQAPRESALRFDPPDDADVTFDDLPDLASESHRFAPYAAPAELAGLTLRRDRPDLPPGAVGVYGRGPTVLLFLPLRGNAARPLREELGGAGSDGGSAVDLGAISALVTPERYRGSGFLLVGTLTPRALEQAAAEVADLEPVDR